MGYTSKYKGAEIDALLDKVEALPEGGNGGGVPIVSSVEELEALNLPVGSVVSVGKEGNIQEFRFRDLYQPAPDILDMNTGVLTKPELLSHVSVLKIAVPEGNISGVSSDVYLVPRTFSMQNQKMIELRVICYDNVLSAVRAMAAVESLESFDIIMYTEDGIRVNQEAIDKINNYLATDDWCYLSNPEGGYSYTEEQFNTLDKFFTIVSGYPTISRLFIKHEEWRELAIKEEVDKLASQVEESRIKKVEVSGYQRTLEMNPNVYYRLGDPVYDLVVSLLEPTEPDVANEYMLEIVCSKSFGLTLPEGLAWANGLAPEMTVGKTFVISIVNNLAVFAEF